MTKDNQPSTTLTMTCTFRGTPKEAEEYLRSQLLMFGADGVADLIDGSERWVVDGNEIEIVESE